MLLRAAPLGLALVLAHTAAIPAAATIYPTRAKGGTNVRVYEQKPWTTTPTASADYGEVLAKYSDLLQKAIAYKTAHPGEAVEVRFTTYRMAYDLYVGFNPAATSTYNVVADSDFAGADSEKLIWSFCKAAQAGVSVKMIIHKTADSSLATLTSYLNTNGGPNLSYKIVNWGDASDDQMHNKFLLVSQTRSGTNEYHSVVYTTSANVDDWSGYGPASAKNWQQTGVLLYQNEGVYNAYKKYFDDALWPHATDTSAAAFRATVTALHYAPGGLNYPEDADGVSAYFYPAPAPVANEDTFWNPAYNPHVLVMGLINTDPHVTDPYVKLNQAYVRFDGSTEFGDRFMDDIRTMATVHSINLASSAVANVRFVLHDSDHVAADLSPIHSSRIAYPRKSHSKNIAYALTYSGTPHYYTTGGSTNAKDNDFTLKANNIIVIHEVGADAKEVYQDFKDIFDNIF